MHRLHRHPVIRAGRTLPAAAILLAVLLSTACGSHVYHRVQKGETVYSIGFLYGQEYQQIAAWNDLDPSDTLTPGQRLRVAPPSHVTERIRLRQGEAAVAERSPSTPAAEDRVVVTAIPDQPQRRALPQPVPAQPVPQPPRPAAPATPRAQGAVQWLRPTDGKVLKGYSAEAIGNKGVDFGGRLGQPVRAVSGGKVVYSGDGLINYGNLIIVKHDERYLSAYGHNEQLRVREGDSVAAGQHIADMGRGPDGTVMLHFEIRYNGKPVDPLRYIPAAN